jgi:low temperature requirement protein LtrA
MHGRSSTEAHRASSPLELLFDLTFVVAVSSLVGQLAEQLVEGHPVAIVAYLQVFFAIWWAWMNFTWFASAYDVDDVLYRVFTLVQMAGVLVLAAGVPVAFGNSNYVVIVIGYLIMRVAMVGQWIRAGIEHPATRCAAFRYAGGVLLVQLGWVLRLLLPPELALASFVVLAIAEMAVPVWAERRVHTSWHPGHIAERYSLFVIILLGESVAVATMAMQQALQATGVTPQLIAIGVAGLELLFGVWWLYFLEPSESGLRRRRQWSYFWGYGHYVLFAAIAAVGVGLEVAVKSVSGEHVISAVGAGYVLAVPVAVVLAVLYVLYRPLSGGADIPGFVLLPAAVVCLGIPLAASSIGIAGVAVALAVLLAVVVPLTMLIEQRRHRAGPAGTAASAVASAAD